MSFVRTYTFSRLKWCSAWKLLRNGWDFGAVMWKPHVKTSENAQFFGKPPRKRRCLQTKWTYGNHYPTHMLSCWYLSSTVTEGRTGAKNQATRSNWSKATCYIPIWNFKYANSPNKRIWAWIHPLANPRGANPAMAPHPVRQSGHKLWVWYKAQRG